MDCNDTTTERALMRDNTYRPGLRIAAWRGLHGRRTLSDTAHDLGVHVSTLGRYERGTGSPPGGATALAILHHIGIPVADWYPTQNREEDVTRETSPLHTRMPGRTVKNERTLR